MEFDRGGEFSIVLCKVSFTFLVKFLTNFKIFANIWLNTPGFLASLEMLLRGPGIGSFIFGHYL